MKCILEKRYARKESRGEDCIIVIRVRHHTLCTGSICRFFSCLPMFVRVKLHICIHAQTLALVTTSPPHPQTKRVLLNMFEQTLRQLKRQTIEETSERNRESRRERGGGVEK